MKRISPPCSEFWYRVSTNGHYRPGLSRCVYPDHDSLLGNPTRQYLALSNTVYLWRYSAISFTALIPVDTRSQG